MSDWKKVIQFLNEEKEIRRKVFYGDDFDVFFSTMDNYLYLLHKCGYVDFSSRHVKTKHLMMRGLYVEYVILKREIPENLTINEAVKIKKQPWLAWFKYYDRKNKL